MPNAIVLAGGKSSRFGSDKAFAEVRGTSIIECLLLLLYPLFKNIIVVSSNKEKYKKFNVEVVSDRIPEKGPLGGIYSGLIESKTEKNFVIACDMPLINLVLVKYLLSIENYDVIVPFINNQVEPLHAVYSKNCIGKIENQIIRNDLKVRNLYKNVNTKYVKEEIVKRYDPELYSFFNVNLKEDLKGVEACLKMSLLNK